MFRDLPSYAGAKSSEFWQACVPESWQEVPGLAVIEENRNKNADLAEKQVLSLSFGNVVVKPVEMQRGLVPESYEGYQVLEPGDIVIRPTDLQNDQRSIRVGFVKERGIITSAYIGLRATGDWEPEYAYLYLSVVDSSKRIYGMGSGLRQQLGWADIKRIPCLVPPVEEQAAIVKYLAHANARINNAIAAKRRLISLLEEQQRVRVRTLLMGSAWPLWPLGHLGRIGNGSTPSRSNPAYWDGDTPWLNSSVVNLGVVDSAEQFVTAAALTECHLPMVEPGSVLVGITGQGKTRGMSAVLRIRATINQHLAFITPRASRMRAEFLHLALTAGYDELRRISDGNGGTKGALTIADLKAFKVPLPALDEQRQFVMDMSDSAAETVLAVERTTREIELLQEFRTRLVADVVTGQVDVRAVAATLPDAVEGGPGTIDGDSPELDEEQGDAAEDGDV